MFLSTFDLKTRANIMGTSWYLTRTKLSVDNWVEHCTKYNLFSSVILKVISVQFLICFSILSKLLIRFLQIKRHSHSLTVELFLSIYAQFEIMLEFSAFRKSKIRTQLVEFARHTQLLRNVNVQASVYWLCVWSSQ